MNGEDLRPLAERSWALEDRSRDRLVEVHARVADARRRRVATAALSCAAAALVAAALVLVALDTDPGRPPEPAPAPSLPMDPSFAPSSAPHRPADGTCWAVPPTSVMDEDYWHDDSPQVPCDEAHTTETVVVLALPEPTSDEVQKRAWDMCSRHVLGYLDIDAQNWIPWGSVALLPSQDQIDDGASWVRCDAIFPADLGWRRARVTTSTAAGIAQHPPPDLWACLDQLPWQDEDQPLVPCDRPHRVEQTGRHTLIARQDEYPTRQEREQASVPCESGIPTRLEGFDVGVVWDPREAFEPGSDVTGICIVYSAAGGLLPARPPDEGARS